MPRSHCCCSLLLPVPVPSTHLLLALSPTIPRLHLQPPTVPIHLLSAGITGIMQSSPEKSCTMFLVREQAGWQVDAFSLPAGSTRNSLVYLWTSCLLKVFLWTPEPLSWCFQPQSQVPGLFLFVLVPVVLTGCSNWLRFQFLSSEWIFSVITTFYWTWPTRGSSAAPLQVPQPSC